MEKLRERLKFQKKDLKRLLDAIAHFVKEKGYIIGVVKSDEFKITKGESFLNYINIIQKQLNIIFCSICGIHTHNRPRIDPKLYGLNIACIEEINPFELKDVPVADGKNHPLDKK